MTGKLQSQWSNAFAEYEGTDTDRAGACEAADPGGNTGGLNGAEQDPAHAGSAPARPRMSMLDFYVNRLQLCLSARERAAIAKAKARSSAKPAESAREDEAP